MNLDKPSNALPIIMTILLLSQVSLSAAIVLRLNSMEERVLTGLNSQELQPQVPQFIPDVSLDDDPRIGTKGAPITLVEFADYECPFCADAAGNVNSILSQYKDKVLFVYRDFPLENIHPHAFLAAEAADCAGDQDAYWKMHDLLFVNQKQLDIDSLRKYAVGLSLSMDRFNTCLDKHKYEDEVRHDAQEGATYQVNGTPTFFINGHRIVGGSLEQLEGTIDSLLQDK